MLNARFSKKHSVSIKMNENPALDRHWSRSRSRSRDFQIWHRLCRARTRYSKQNHSVYAISLFHYPIRFPLFYSALTFNFKFIRIIHIYLHSCATLFFNQNLIERKNQANSTHKKRVEDSQSKKKTNGTSFFIKNDVRSLYKLRLHFSLLVCRDLYPIFVYAITTGKHKFKHFLQSPPCNDVLV